jgi:hypothetical protein
MLVRDDGSIVGMIGGGCVEADVWPATREVRESEKPRTLTFDLNQDPQVRYGLGVWWHAGSFCRANFAAGIALHFWSKGMWLCIYVKPRPMQVST